MEAVQITNTPAVQQREVTAPELIQAPNGMVWGLVVSNSELRWLWAEVQKDTPEDVCIDFETYGWVQEWTEKKFIEADSAQIAGTAVAWGDRTFTYQWGTKTSETSGPSRTKSF